MLLRCFGSDDLTQLMRTSYLPITKRLWTTSSICGYWEQWINMYLKVLKLLNQVSSMWDSECGLPSVFERSSGFAIGGFESTEGLVSVSKIGLVSELSGWWRRALHTTSNTLPFALFLFSRKMPRLRPSHSGHFKPGGSFGRTPDRSLSNLQVQSNKLWHMLSTLE